MARNVFTLHIAFCPKSHRHDQYLPQFIRCDEEYTRNGLVTLMREFIAFSALFTWLHLPCEKVEEQATEPVVYTKGLRQFIQPATYSANFGDITDPDIIVIIGNEGTLGPTAMKREFPKASCSGRRTRKPISVALNYACSKRATSFRATTSTRSRSKHAYMHSSPKNTASRSPPSDPSHSCGRALCFYPFGSTLE